jgi:hypothetical protein
LAAVNYNVHFDVAPAVGAAITIDYTTKVVAKDANHVFDLELVFDYSEYTEEY